ncbi:riboflavin synthase [Candidatus Gracilibacteria bacterium]|nr:riboflavin synthase [Candidatus Gracilibacteria bacterium]
MFTGIIEKKSSILSVDGGKFTVENHFGSDLKVGRSIAHDGACMTIESFNDNAYSFFVMEESLNKTNFGNKRPGGYFNIARCFKAEDRVDGHFVSGHIDISGVVSSLDKKTDGSLIVGVDFSEEFSKFTIKKGSIAINGVSLTVVDKKPAYISVSLIPLTQDWTNLGDLQVGESVNLEFDMLGKYILNMHHDS